MHNLTLTLAIDWADWIWIIVIGATVVGSWISNLKKQSNEQRKQDEGPNVAELEAIAARRREQLRQTQSRVQSGGGAAGGGEPGNLTMAERIARARAKAQYEQRAQRTGQAAGGNQPQVPNEAQRRALAQRQAELERRRQAARAQQQSQQRARQQAQQRAQQQAQQRARQQRAQAHARAQAQARQSGKLVHEHVVVPEPTESTTRRRVARQKPQRRPAQPAPVTTDMLTDPTEFTSLSRNELRRAIIMNEVLGKPLALREQAG